MNVLTATYAEPAAASKVAARTAMRAVDPGDSASKIAAVRASAA